MSYNLHDFYMIFLISMQCFNWWWVSCKKIISLQNITIQINKYSSLQWWTSLTPTVVITKLCAHEQENQPSSLTLLCTLQSQVSTCTMCPRITSLPLLSRHGSLGFLRAWERGTSANETTTNTEVHAPWIAMDPNFVAGILEREPFKPPIGVRPKPTMHTSAPIGIAIKRSVVTQRISKPPQLCQFLWFHSSINSLGLLQPRKSWGILLLIIFILKK